MLKPTLAAALTIGLLSATASQASSVYYLDQSNKLADGINYLQVTISDDRAPGVIDFSVKALQPLLDLAGDNFGIDKFAFNIVGGVSAEASDVDLLPAGWRARDGGRMDGFGLFDVRLKGRGNARQDPLTFSITGVDLDTIQSYIDLSTGRAPQGFSLFAAHVSGLNLGDCKGGDSEDNGTKGPLGVSSGKGDDGKGGGKGGHDGGKKCVTSAYFGDNTSAVPAPPALWLLGTAIGGLAVRRFRRAKTQGTAAVTTA